MSAQNCKIGSSRTADRYSMIGMDSEVYELFKSEVNRLGERSGLAFAAQEYQYNGIWNYNN